MARQRSNAHLAITINGHRIVGLADEDQPYQFEWPDLAEINTGADGGKYGRAIPDFGCGFMVRLADTSDSLAWAIDQRAMHFNALRNGSPIPEFRATITDLAFNISGSMEGGWLANIPAGRPRPARWRSFRSVSSCGPRLPRAARSSARSEPAP